MAIGGLVAVPELQAEGPARLEGQTSGYFTIRFLASGAEMTVEQRTVVRYALLPGTRVTVELAGAPEDGVIADQPPRTEANGLISYPVRCDNGVEEDIGERLVLAVAPPADPAEQLRCVAFHEQQPRFAHAGTPKPPEPWGPATYCAREAMLDWRDRSWRDTGGVVALAGSRVVPLPHQLLAARRILGDRRVRFLLADEVGLGKTIEAGLVMQSLLAAEPNLRVLIVVPGGLSSQWFLELYVKFGGRRFLMLDAQRLADYQGNPWQEQFLIASSRALEELAGKDALRFATSKWDLVIVDECHRMQPDGVLYKRLATLSKKTPHVLLLSATPARRHAEAYLALLHLLQPDAYPLDDLAGFESKWQQAEAVGALLARTRAADAFDEALAQAWLALLAGDEALPELIAAARAGTEHAEEALVAYVREHYQLDHRVIRNRRQVLARLSAATGVHGLELGERSRRLIGYPIDAVEAEVRQAMTAYRDGLLAAWAATEDIPPRLAHWLLLLELALAGHVQVLDRLLAMRAAVVEEPEAFAEYRQRARPEEDLARVLGADLSEAESSSHVAISASCYADHPDEPELLAAVQHNVARWRKRVPSRTRTLVEELKKFWNDWPQEKVLVFTGHAIGVQAIAEYLASRLGAGAVAQFGAHQEAMQREAEAGRFKNDENCWVLVSDALGGEGRNFQFVSLVVHHDLPWSIAAIEQRIGRVDRLGRDGEVASWVLQPDDAAAVDGAWVDVVDQAVGVFTQSSSGLEFVAGQCETRAAEVALRQGGAGLRQISDELQAAVAAERAARDDHADELFGDSQSAFAAAADLAERIARARVPVSECCRWLRGMGGHVRRDEDQPRPFRLRARSADQPMEGVFDRRQALQHEQLHFFARGHDLIDQLIADAEQAGWCAATAWRRRPVPSCRAWEGVRLSFELAPDLQPLISAGLPVAVLRRLYAQVPPQRLYRYVDANGKRVTDPTLLAHLDKPFDAKAGDSTLSPKVSREAWMRPLLGGRLPQVLGWQQKIDRALAAAEAWRQELQDAESQVAVDTLSAPLRAQAALAAAQAANAARRLGAEHPDSLRLAAEAEEEAQQGEVLLEAIAGAELRLVGAAYLLVG